MSQQPAPEGDLLAERAFRALRDVLRSGELRAGQFLSMPGLVTALGFPIAAVREAVKRADMAGLLSVMPKRGVVVMDAGPEATRACLDMRAMFDGEGARRRIATASLDGLEALVTAHRAMLEEARAGSAPDLPGRAMRTDLSLHDWLAAGLGNPHLDAAYAANRDRIAVIQASRPFLADRIMSAMEEHLAVLEAVQARDAAAAVSAIQHHHAQTLRWWGVTA
jgi:DNA-binding GntR family transcriptional regulator